MIWYQFDLLDKDNNVVGGGTVFAPTPNGAVAHATWMAGNNHVALRLNSTKYPTQSTIQKDKERHE